MWIYILQGIGYGLAAAAQPGPFQAYIISQTLTRGWKRTLPASFAPLISDGPIIAVCLLVLSQVPNWLQRALYMVGGCFVLYLAHGAFRAWQRFEVQGRVAPGAVPQGILKAALTNVLNPNPYIYWTLVTGPVLLRGWRETPVNGIGFLGGFYGVLVLSLMGIILVFGMARGLGPRVNRALLGISAAALLAFGVYQLWLGLSSA